MLQGRKIPFVKDVKYLGLIFYRIVTWRVHTETVPTKAFRKFIRLYPILKTERLSTNTELNLHEALIMSERTYACLSWEFAADNHLLKLQRLQNRVLRTISNLPRHTVTHDLHRAFKISHVYDYVTKMCMKQEEAIQNHDNINV